MSIPKENIPMENITELLKKSDDINSLYDCIYKLYFYIGIAKGVDDAKNGRGMTLEESRERMLRKYETYNTRYGS